VSAGAASATGPHTPTPAWCAAWELRGHRSAHAAQGGVSDPLPPGARVRGAAPPSSRPMQQQRPQSAAAWGTQGLACPLHTAPTRHRPACLLPACPTTHLGCLIVDRALAGQVTLVPHQQLVHVLVGVPVDLGQPGLDVVEALHVRHIIDHLHAIARVPPVLSQSNEPAGRSQPATGFYDVEVQHACHAMRHPRAGMSRVQAHSTVPSCCTITRTAQVATCVQGHTHGCPMHSACAHESAEVLLLPGKAVAVAAATAHTTAKLVVLACSIVPWASTVDSRAETP